MSAKYSSRSDKDTQRSISRPDPTHLNSVVTDFASLAILKGDRGNIMPSMVASYERLLVELVSFLWTEQARSALGISLSATDLITVNVHTSSGDPGTDNVVISSPVSGRHVLAPLREGSQAYYDIDIVGALISRLTDPATLDTGPVLSSRLTDMVLAVDTSYDQRHDDLKISVGCSDKESVHDEAKGHASVSLSTQWSYVPIYHTTFAESPDLRLAAYHWLLLGIRSEAWPGPEYFPIWNQELARTIHVECISREIESLDVVVQCIAVDFRQKIEYRSVWTVKRPQDSTEPAYIDHGAALFLSLLPSLLKRGMHRPGVELDGAQLPLRFLPYRKPHMRCGIVDVKVLNNVEGMAFVLEARPLLPDALPAP